MNRLRPLPALLTSALAGAALALVLGACPTAAAREICNNGLDDDGNGLLDCDDPDCAGQPVCYWGPCAKCGTHCTQQSQCLAQGYTSDTPIPFCKDTRCEAFNQRVDVAMQFDTTSWQGLGAPGSTVLRFVSQAAIDGGAVTCATLEAAASGKTAADVDQLERTGRFQYLGFDARPRLQSGSFAPNYTVPLVPVGTGSGYVIWFEAWGGVINPDTRLPQGSRLGWACYEDPKVVTPIVLADNCPSTTNDAGTCRRFELSFPAPR